MTFSQSTNVWHANTLSDDDTSTLTLANAADLQVVQTVTDADGDKDTAAINLGAGVFQIEDDGPNAVVAIATPDTLVLDETRPVGSEEDGDSAPAGLATVTANFADNFAVPPDFGSDGPGSASYSLVLTGSNVASGLFALGVADAAGASIVLNQAAPGADIIGTVGAVEYFRISIDPATGVVTFSQSTNVWHANTLSDDDTSTLTLANAADLQVVQTVTDADGDKDTAAINLGAGVFQIEDDGPNAVVAIATPDTLVLDETRPVGSEEDGDSAPAGLATVTANFADNFVALPDFGSDVPGSASYSLVLTGSNVASGLFALGVGGAAGASIVLNQAAPGADIIGTVGGTEYFRISIAPATGVVTFSQSTNVWHANTLSDDDTSTLTLANAADLQVVQTVTDADGDKDTASINLGAGVFQIEDDGPNAVVANATPDTLVLDETRPVGSEEDGDSAPAGLATVTANFADNFAVPPDFGSDGPWQRVLFAGSDRFERGVGSVCAWRERSGGCVDRAEPGGAWCRHHRHGGRHRILPHQHRPGDGRGDVQPEHQRLARQHRQRRRHLDADAGERRRSAGGADADGRRRRQGHGGDQSGRGCVPDRGRRPERGCGDRDA